MYIDVEVFDAFSRNLTHTIGQSSICERDLKQWLFKPERF
jgi:hypothetical protein